VQFTGALSSHYPVSEHGCTGVQMMNIPNIITFRPSVPQYLRPSVPHSLSPSAPVPHSPSVPLPLHPSAPPCACVCEYKRESVWYKFSRIYIYIYIYINIRTKSSRIQKYQHQIVHPIKRTWSLSGSIHKDGFSYTPALGHFQVRIKLWCCSFLCTLPRKEVLWYTYWPKNGLLV